MGIQVNPVILSELSNSTAISSSTPNPWVECSKQLLNELSSTPYVGHEARALQVEIQSMVNLLGQASMSGETSLTLGQIQDILNAQGNISQLMYNHPHNQELQTVGAQINSILEAALENHPSAPSNSTLTHSPATDPWPAYTIQLGQELEAARTFAGDGGRELQAQIESMIDMVGAIPSKQNELTFAQQQQVINAEYAISNLANSHHNPAFHELCGQTLLTLSSLFAVR